MKVFNQLRSFIIFYLFLFIGWLSIFLLEEYGIIILLFGLYLLPLLVLGLILIAYLVGKDIQKKNQWSFKYRIIFSVIGSILIGFSYNFAYDIYRCIQFENFNFHYTLGLITDINMMKVNAPIYIFIAILFISFLIGQQVENYKALE